MDESADVAAEVGEGGEEAVRLDVHAQHVLEVAREVAAKWHGGQDVAQEMEGA